MTGSPAEIILDYTDDTDVDLVGMGTHGRRGLRRYLTGSAAERIVRTSPVPVLTVEAAEGAPPVAAYDDIMVPTPGSALSGKVYNNHYESRGVRSVFRC